MCSPIAGAIERIAQLRNRHKKVSSSIKHYEQLIVEQDSQMQRMNKRGSFGADHVPDRQASAVSNLNDLDLARDQEEVKELERKKQMLEARVTGMEKDLGGLLR